MYGFITESGDLGMSAAVDDVDELIENCHHLMQQGRAYNGMAYRYVAENIEKLIPVDDTYHYYFVGFNAISACEDTIIRQYLRQGIGTVISDGDAYYFNDPNQEAGHFPWLPLRSHSGMRVSSWPAAYPSG